ncbi:enoyl-CoA hydratase/isomerase family protein [Pseudonocardia alaniniphila]|uniref:Enoyl-CoA hydratase/isomerase family protein n=1 Tax=Pseudonocardia alaniniphila TaxID=75291 RepID=A0ABS9TUR2_9PSEU|nr:enoyl-CoA hydratase/isomerase family protein [Pseudonocardia alaniniphila]MCH6172308.1 enoyl-CoA hydratase/isomerase family protein [Pseudonocardia alaniniphila]
MTGTAQAETERTGAADAVASTPAPDAALVTLTMDGAVAVATMRYAPHNFLNMELLDALVAAARGAVAQGARAMVVRSGLRNFCAGADVRLFESSQRGEAPTGDLTTLLSTFDELPIPILASVNGVCIGGGLELALACDLIVAAESAKIGSIEASVGLNPLMGGIQRVTQRAGAARAKEMALLGRRYDAATMARWNIINWVVPDEQLVDVTATIAQELAHGPTVAHASTKALVSHAVEHGVRATDEAMHELQRDIWRSEDLKIGLASLQAEGPGAARFEGR